LEGQLDLGRCRPGGLAFRTAKVTSSLWTMRVRQRIEAAGASLLYLPSFSPGFNPIENAFAKVKPPLREAAERTVDRLLNAIRFVVDLFAPDECRN
jgi:transposase